MNLTWTIAISAAVLGAVSYATTDLLKVGMEYLRRRWRAHRGRREILTDGDHQALSSAGRLEVGPGQTDLSRIAVTILPAVAFDADGQTLDLEAVADWVEMLSPHYAGNRRHCDPDTEISYVLGDCVVEVKNSGVIRIIVPVMDERGWEEHPKSASLDVHSVVVALAHALTAILHERGYRYIFLDRMCTPNVDWHVNVSDRVMINGTSMPRVGLTFQGRDPDRSTAGQVAISAGAAGFGGDKLKNVSIDTDEVGIMMIVLRALIEKSGYSGLRGCLEDLHLESESELASAKSQFQI